MARDATLSAATRLRGGAARSTLSEKLGKSVGRLTPPGAPPGPISSRRSLVGASTVALARASARGRAGRGAAPWRGDRPGGGGAVFTWERAPIGLGGFDAA